jgi:D-glycero-beta-D-manno-heptose-7-phosphate kinase
MAINREPGVTVTDSRLRELLAGFPGKTVAVIGDLMIDRYYWGNVHRVSPEAPVPVVEVESESVRLGGAANVASNIQALGGSAVMVGLVGNDHPGEQLQALLRERGFDTSAVLIDKGRPTTVKTRVIAHGQHVVRIDNESKQDASEALAATIIDVVRRNIRSFDGVVLEDYNKGVVTREVIREVIALAREHGVPVTVDPKFNNFFEFKQVTVFKPNRREVEEVLGGKLRSTEDVVRAGKKLIELLGAENVLLTRGEEGMSLIEAGGGVTHLPTAATHVADVSGAGDTVIATLTMALAAGAGMKEACLLANCAGGVVVGSVGIVPIQPDELVAAVRHFINHSPAH